MNSKMPLGYYIYRLILSPIFKLYYNPRIIGKENIPKKGSIVIAANHKHLYDQCLIIVATRRGIHYMAKKEYFDDKKVAWFFKSAGCISVDRSKKDDKATTLALDVLRDNGAIGIFPEGTRNKTKEFLLPFKFGAVSMAKKTGSMIVPCGITGDYTFRSKNLTVNIGKPFSVDDISLEEANLKLYQEIERLMKESIKNNDTN